MRDRRFRSQVGGREGLCSREIREEENVLGSQLQPLVEDHSE